MPVKRAKNKEDIYYLRQIRSICWIKCNRRLTSDYCKQWFDVRLNPQCRNAAKYPKIGPWNGTITVNKRLITFARFNIFECGLLLDLPCIKGFPKHINMWPFIQLRCRGGVTDRQTFLDFYIDRYKQQQ